MSGSFLCFEDVVFDTVEMKRCTTLLRGAGKLGTNIIVGGCVAQNRKLESPSCHDRGLGGFFCAGAGTTAGDLVLFENPASLCDPFFAVIGDVVVPKGQNIEIEVSQRRQGFGG